MLRWKNIFLAAALIEFAVGFSDARPAIFFYLGRPLGGILFGLFLIAMVFEKESELFDQQTRAQRARVEESPPKQFSREVAAHPALANAHSH